MSEDPRIGTVIAGHRIEAVIGRGGMGVVYRAEQPGLGRHVAMKLIAPELAQDEGFRERFKRESRLAASIEHPNVIPVHEAGEADGALFITMRYVDGTDLRALIGRQGRLDPPHAAAIVAQVGAALDAAHARGLVHRDVKPANVLIASVSGEEHAYLTDFGLTKHAASQAGLTNTGEWVGTLDYVAPEQIQGGSVDARTDVYALGCVLHQIITGDVPYRRDSDVAKMYAHLNDPPPAASGVVPGVPEELDAVIARALAKDPDERFPSAGDLGRAAVAAAERRAPAEPERSVARGNAAPVTVPAAAATVRAPEPTRRAEPAVPAAQEPATGATRKLPERRRGRGLAAALVAAALGAALLGGGLFVAGVFDDDDPQPSGRVTPEPEEPGGGDRPEPEPEPEPGSGGGGGDRVPAGFQPYRASSYTAAYPEGWRIAEDDELRTTFSRTRFVAPDGAQSVLIDRSPGQDTPPATSARRVEAQTAATAGYEQLGFEPTEVNGTDAFEWTFRIGSERKIDIFLVAGGDGYAVLGEGPDFESVIAATRRVAGSIEPRG